MYSNSVNQRGSRTCGTWTVVALASRNLLMGSMITKKKKPPQTLPWSRYRTWKPEGPRCYLMLLMVNTIYI